MKKHVILLLFLVGCLPAGLLAQATVGANTGDGLSAYGTFAAAGFLVEGPDASSSACADGSPNDAGNHSGFGEHVLEVADATLEQDVFAFVSHIDEDSDRCVTFDRVRMEIKGGPAGQSDPELEHTQGSESHYRWQFQLPADFQGSSSFCHLFQNKAQGGSETGFPVLTLTARASVMELIHAPQDAGSSAVDLAIVPLGPFLGQWVEADVRQLHADNGELSFVIRDVATGAVLLDYSNSNIDLWRSGATINRPKWGIYRKIVSGLKDETLRFGNFCSSESGDICPSLVGNEPPAQETVFSTPLTVAESRRRRTLDWGVSFQNNSDFFTVERSNDGTNFFVLDQLAAAGTLAPEQLYTYRDATAATPLMAYRVRLINQDGSTLLSNTVTIDNTGSGGGGGGGNGNGGGKPKKSEVYPNPATDLLSVPVPLESTYAYRVVDGSGRSLQSGVLRADRRVDVRALPRGAYVLLVNGADGQRQLWRFVRG